MYTLYGIKNCDTIKKARKFLDERNIPYQFHDYRVDGLQASLLRRFIEELGWEALLNKRGTTWRQLPDAEKNGLNAEKAMQLMMAKPALIKRPILDTQQGLVLGFNTELYQAL